MPRSASKTRLATLLRFPEMKSARFFRTSIRRSLVMGSILLTVGAIAAFSISIYSAIYRPLQSNLTGLAMRRASGDAARDVAAMFARVEGVAAREREWGRDGLIALDDLDRLNRLEVPLFSAGLGISSMAIAEDGGHEVLTVSQPGGRWFNRLTDPDAWGHRGRFLDWDEHATLVSDQQRDTDYDARQRPWFAAGASLQKDTDIYWTAPYRFVSTGELGMSAVVRWLSPTGRRSVMTTDITLLNLTRLAQEISVGKSGLAAVLTEDGKMLGLPRDDQLKTVDAINTAGLMSVEALAVPPLTLAFRSWQALGRPASSIVPFTIDQTRWLATFTPIHLTTQSLWVAALAPESDFQALRGDTLALGIALVLGTIVIASLGAIWLSRRFSRPIEQLTSESARIGQMNLTRPIEVGSSVREIDALARSLEMMRQNLHEAAAEREAKAKLELQLEQSRKLEIVGQLAAGIAHDFNNILGAILGFAGFLLQDLKTGTEQYKFAQRIISSSERAKDLVRQILAFSRRTEVERKPIDLNRIVRDAEGLLRATLPASTRLRIAIPAEPLVVYANEAQISQILLNLAVNANDALGGRAGSVTIELSRVDEREPDKLGIEDYPSAEAFDGGAGERFTFGNLAPSRGYALISVADTGAGIGPEDLPRIFDPFFTTKERGRGTGLGLSVVRNLVELYGGAGGVMTRPGAGSTFWIRLPLIAAEPVVATPMPTELRGRESVLVVDDEMDLTDVLAIGLERLGYEVVALNDPEKVVALFNENADTWDVVVTDQVMPAMSGLALLKRLKAIRPATRFILCTGFSDAASEEMAREAGADGFFLKPVAPEQIAAAIRQLFDTAPARDVSSA